MRTAIVSTYPPRVCGIGAFAADLRETLIEVAGVDDVAVVPIVNEPSRPQGGGPISMIGQAVRGDYVRAARTLGRLDVDAVLLQHEYGIFGGRDGDYVLSFAEELPQPLVVTLHTVLSRPTPHQLQVLTESCAAAGLGLVRSESALRLLLGCGACRTRSESCRTARRQAHGAPVSTRHGQTLVLRANGRPRFLLSTFGLISPGEGWNRDRGLAVDDRAAPQIVM